MSDYLYDAPLPAALTVQVPSAISFRFDQVIRLFLQQPQSSASFTSTTIKVLSNWTTLVAATDATKIVYTPCFSSFVMPPSTEMKQGGNTNETINGIPDYFSESYVPCTGSFRNLDPVTEAALRSLTIFSLQNAVAGTSLTAYMVNKDGFIFSDAAWNGIKIFNFRLGTRGSAGLNQPDMTPFSFDLKPFWSKSLTVNQPSFDPISAFV